MPKGARQGNVPAARAEPTVMEASCNTLNNATNHAEFADHSRAASPFIELSLVSHARAFFIDAYSGVSLAAMRRGE